MQSRGWRRHRAFLRRINRLVALAVGLRIRASDIRRQGDMTYPVQYFIEIAARMQSHGALTELAAPQNLRRKIGRDQDPLAGSHLPAGMNQRFPSEAVVRDRPREEHFYFSCAVLAAAQQAPRKQ